MSRRFLTACCITCWLLTISLLLLAQDELRYPSADAASYVGIAMSAKAGNYAAFANPYWSPLYPVLLFLFLPSDLSQGLPQVGMLVLQGVLLTALIGSFAYFVTGISRLEVRSRANTLWLGLVSFLFFLAFHIKMYLVTYTPDTLVAVLIFCALGLISRSLWSENHMRLNIVLGGVLAAGYWAKAVYFPASVLLLGWLFVTRWQAKLPLRPALAGAAVFLLLSAPLIWMTSLAAGRPTFGESGRLNYGWSVNRYEMHMGWHGVEPGSGKPLHPPRVLFQNPLVLEFAEPGAGSFPLWDNPAQWHQGMQTHVSVPGILAALQRNLTAIVRPVFFWLALALPAFFMGGGTSAGSLRRLGKYSCLWLWPLAVIAFYCLVAIETRYLTPLAVASVVSLLWLCPLHSSLARMAFGLQLATVAIASGWMLYTCFPSRTRSDTLDSRWSYEKALGEYLRSHGLHRGDLLANVGDLDSTFFAQSVGVQISSWVKKPKPQELTPEKWSNIVGQWRNRSIAAVISKCRDGNESIDSIAAGVAVCSSPLASSIGLERVPGTPYFVKMLR